MFPAVSAQTEPGDTEETPSIFSMLSYAIVEIFSFLKLRLFGPDCKTLPTLPNFDLDRFIAKSWYVQRKQVTEYQDYSERFCITETYNRYGTDDPTSITYDKDKINIVKYLTGQGGGGVNINPLVGDFMCLTPWGKGGQFKNAPCLLPPFLTFLGGPYWVVDTDYDNYAILVSGALSERGSCDDKSGLCTVPIRGELLDPGSWVGQRQGLYYFTRAAFPTDALMATVETKAIGMGICTAAMLDVVHEGCTYTTARLKQ
jgi:hypothetical protein